MNPGAKLVAGYANQVPSFQGKLNDDQIFWLRAYIKSLTPDAKIEDELNLPASEAREKVGVADGEKPAAE